MLRIDTMPKGPPSKTLPSEGEYVLGALSSHFVHPHMDPEGHVHKAKDS